MQTLQTLPKKSGRGGYRPGAGRPKGSIDKVTVSGLLSALEARTNCNYEDILIEDFLRARYNDDSQLVIKYHTLILNRVLSSKTHIEIENSDASLEAKQAAFAAALQQLTDSH